MNILQPWPSLPGGIEIEKGAEVMITPMSQPVLVPSYINQSLLFSVTRCTMPELGKNHAISIGVGTMYSWTTVYKKEADEDPSEIGANAAVHAAKKERVDELEVFATSVMTKKRKTAMRDVNKNGALWAILDPGFRTLQKEHELREKALSEKVDIVIWGTPYNVPKDQNDKHTKYDGFETNDMKDKDTSLGDVMKQGVHAHLFCSAFHSFLW